MMSARKQERHSRAWNYYSGVPLFPRSSQEAAMNGIIYLIGLIVVILAILSFFGLRNRGWKWLISPPSDARPLRSTSPGEL
jgi:hypothetical protein